jgi:RNA polymerase sigma factor (sigma-70 family)
MAIVLNRPLRQTPGPLFRIVHVVAKEFESELRAMLATYSGLVRATIARLKPRSARIELDDLQQEVHIRLWQALSRERELRKPASYIKRIVLTATIDAIRRAEARGDSQTDTPLDDISSFIALEADAGPIEGVASRQLLEHVQAALGDDPDRARVVSLYVQGCTTEEIGALLGWTEAKARNVVYRALAHLREVLGARHA